MTKLFYILVFCTIITSCSKYSPTAPEVYPQQFPTSSPSAQIVPDSPTEIPVIVNPDEVSIYDPGNIYPSPDAPAGNEEGTDNSIIEIPVNNEITPGQNPVSEPVNDILTELSLKYSFNGSDTLSTFFSPLAQKVFETINNNSTSESSSPVKKQFLTTTGNRFIRPLVDGVEIFTAFKDTLARARHEVALVSFEWNSKSDAARMIGEGIKLAEQNFIDKKIVVRIIIDDFNIDPRRIVDELNSSRKNWNIDETKIDLQLATYPHTAFGASHNKYLVVDGKYVIITGANVQTRHDFNENIWHDSGYMIEGSTALTILNDFDEAWARHTNHYICQQRSIPIDCLRSKTPAPPDRNYLLDISYEGGIPIIALPKVSRELISDKIDNPTDQGWLAAMDNAVNTINIETPNINSKYFQDAVINAVKRGITVKIITNLGFNDLVESIPGEGGKNEEIVNNLIKRINKEDKNQADKLKFGWYSKDGQKPIDGNIANASHTKYMSVDGIVTIIGSGNMDTQSWTQSRELNLLLDDQDTTQQILNAFYNNDWEKSIKVVY